jgi:hypothetical protein
MIIIIIIIVIIIMRSWMLASLMTAG